MEEELTTSFWAINLEPGKKFQHIPRYDLHITHAVLPAAATDKERTLINVAVGDEEEGLTPFTIASLTLDRNDNQSLSLNFDRDIPLTFSVTGKNPVHLTGFYNAEEDDSDLEGLYDFDGEEEDEEDEEEEEEETPDFAEIQKLTHQDKKRKESPAEHNAPAKKAKDEKPQFKQDKPKKEQQGEKPVNQHTEKGEDQQEHKKKKKNKNKQNGQEPTENGEKKAPQTPNGEKKAPQTPREQNGEKKAPQTPKGEQNVEKKAPQTPKGEHAETPKKELNKEGGNKAHQEVKKYPSGLETVDLQVGQGDEAKSGQKVLVKYHGSLTVGGKTFDQGSIDFKLGAGDVIKGWDLGVAGMKVGGRRRIVIPPALGYGNQKQGPIPANSSLTFEVELKKVFNKK